MSVIYSKLATDRLVNASYIKGAFLITESRI